MFRETIFIISQNYVKISVLQVTYKFFRNWEVIKQLHTAKVIPSGQRCARVIEMGSVDIGLVCILWPHTHYFLPKHTVGGWREEGGGWGSRGEGRVMREEERREREGKEQV